MSQPSRGLPIPSTPQRIAIPGREGQYFEKRDLSTTPGGTIYGTTPGGTRIVYDRETLLALRNSPLSQTPPKNMAKIPGITVPLDADMPEHSAQAASDHNSDDEKVDQADGKDATTFQME